MAAMRSIGHGMFVWGRQRSPEEYASLEKEIENLERLTLVNSTEDELKAALDAVGRGYISRRFYSVPLTSFRARPADELWRKVSELVAPPANKTSAGRFNKAGKPVRYFASDPGTALMEIRAKPLRQYVLLVTKARKPTKPIGFAQFGLSRLPQVEAFRNAFPDGANDGLAAEPRLASLLEQLGVRQFWLKQDKYFNSLATDYFNPENAERRYKLSELLGQQMLSMRDVQGMFYPTAQNNYNGLNIAMPERLAAANLLSQEAWLIQMGRSVDPVGVGPRLWDGDVVRRGLVGRNGDITWGERVKLSPEALHMEIAPARHRR